MQYSCAIILLIRIQFCGVDNYLCIPNCTVVHAVTRYLKMWKMMTRENRFHIYFIKIIFTNGALACLHSDASISFCQSTFKATFRISQSTYALAEIRCLFYMLSRKKRGAVSSFVIKYCDEWAISLPRSLLHARKFNFFYAT